MRPYLALVGVALGCSAANPAFDEAKRGDGPGDDGAGESSGMRGSTSSSTGGEGSDAPSTASASGSDATSEGEESEAGSTDLPPVAACELAPSPGLALGFGDPNYFGGSCPPSVSIWARVDVAGADEMTLASCAENCLACSGAHPLSTSPLSITDHVPADGGVCLRLETEVPLGDDGETCFWGALTIHDAALDVPYLIATAASHEPTPTGVELIAGAVPAPEPVLTCACDTLDAADLCCAEGDTRPEFWAYPIDGRPVWPGESASLPIAAQAGVDHVFEVFQAQAIPTCEGTVLSTSWAVFLSP